MAIEIERKFLVTGDGWRTLGQGKVYRQGYIARGQGRTVRVRIAGDQGYLTIKGAAQGLARPEFEYAIPLADAEQLLAGLCDRPLIEKTRYRVPWSGLVWEIDEFWGDNQGLILAEVELTDEHQAIDRPDWIGEDVSHDTRYYNANLVNYPFCQWGKA